MIEKNEPARSKSVLALAILICFSAIIIITGFLLFPKKPSPVPVQPEMNPETATMPEINIADWQTYKNEEYGLEVKYPQDFKGEELGSGDVLLDAEKTEGGSSFYLTIKARPNYTVDQIVSSVKSAEKITVGGHPGYKYFYTEGIGESGVALIQIGQDELSIIFDSIGNGQNFKNAGDRKIYVQKMLDKILSTLKFTEQDETADWEVYRNEEYGFEFKYPNTLFLTKQEEGAIILSSFSTTDIEASPVFNLAISIKNIKTSSYEDAQSYIKNLPNYLEGSGPYEKNISGALVYINTIKLYEGGEGVSRNYYFPKFVLIFAYANNDAENKFKDSEEKIFSTLKLTEK